MFPGSLVLGSLWAPEKDNFRKLRALENALKIKVQKIYKHCEHGCPNGWGLSLQIVFLLDTTFETLRQTGAKRRQDVQNRRFFFKIYATSHPQTDPSEFSLLSSQHLCRTWGLKDGSKFRTLRSFLFLANPEGEPPSCTFCTFLGVRRCHAGRRL